MEGRDKLEIISVPRASYHKLGEVFYPPTTKSFTIGRGEDDDVRLHPHDKALSGENIARLDYDKDTKEYGITCLATKIPVRFKLLQGKKYLLNADDWVFFGYNFCLHIVSVENHDTCSDDDFINLSESMGKTQQQTSSAKTPPYIFFRVISFKSGEVFIGSQEYNKELVKPICIGRQKGIEQDIHIKDKEISKEHAFLNYDKEHGWHIYDNPEKPSHNGTFIAVKGFTRKGQNDSAPKGLLDGCEIFFGDLGLRMIQADS